MNPNNNKRVKLSTLVKLENDVQRIKEARDVLSHALGVLNAALDATPRIRGSLDVTEGNLIVVESLVGTLRGFRNAAAWTLDSTCGTAHGLASSIEELRDALATRTEDDDR